MVECEGSQARNNPSGLCSLKLHLTQRESGTYVGQQRALSKWYPEFSSKYELSLKILGVMEVLKLNEGLFS